MIQLSVGSKKEGTQVYHIIESSYLEFSISIVSTIRKFKNFATVTFIGKLK